MALKKEEITDKQKELLDFYIRFVEEHGYQPSQTEVAEAFGVQRRSIHDRMRQLQDKGYIVMPEVNRERTVKIVGVKFKAYIDEPEESATSPELKDTQES